jgi:hypothetical protein
VDDFVGAFLLPTLTAETEFGVGAGNALLAAFALREHGEFASDLIVFGNG